LLYEYAQYILYSLKISKYTRSRITAAVYIGGRQQPDYSKLSKDLENKSINASLSFAASQSVVTLGRGLSSW
jgi:hypothetical protein